MANLKEGDVAPDFELPDIDMNLRKLGEFKGRNTLLAFFRLQNLLYALQRCASLEIR
jgi:Peroxiredoxin